MKKETYGEIGFKMDLEGNGIWTVNCRPQVAIRLKNLFQRAYDGTAGTIKLRNTAEVCRDLEWFLNRYPMKVSEVDLKLLHRGGRRHRDTVQTIEEMIDPDYKPREFKLKLPARTYQRQGADIFLTVKALLCADDVGLGKTVQTIAALTDKRTLPAVVVTLANTMPQQWEAEFKRFLPEASVHVVKTAKPYELPKFFGRGPDVVIVNYHKLSKWRAVLGAYAKAIIFDECQELRRANSDKYTAAADIAGQASYRLGLSVGPDSMILVRDGSVVRYMRIDDFAESVGAIDDIFVPVAGVEIRSFDGTRFCWKNLKAVLRHSSIGKKTFRIHTAKGRSLVLTEDHSVYRVRSNGHCLIKQQTKPIMDLQVVRGIDLKEGDEVLLEDTISEEKTLRELDIVDYITASRWFVNGDFADWIEGHVTSDSGYSNAHLVRYRQIVVGHRGTYVTGAQYIGSPELRAKPGRIYTQGHGGIWTCPRLPVEDSAYILGFYLGDGWVDRNRICFAIQNQGVRRFLRKAAPFFKWTKCNLSIRTMPGKSVEIRFCNLVLANFFMGFFRNAKAWEKQIPDEVFSFSYEDTRSFIMGMLDSDGSFSLRKTKKAWSYTTTSKELADGLVELLKKVNVVAGITKSNDIGSGGIINGRKINSTRPKYQVYFSHYEWMQCNDGHHGRRQKYAPGAIAGYPAKIKRIVPEEAATVFDLSVDGTQWPSFVASGILVHNSATPIYNFGFEIWNVYNVLAPGVLGTDVEFKREWCSGGVWVKDPKALGAYLREQGLMIRRTRSDVGRELPPLTKIVQTVETDSEPLAEVATAAEELAKIILSGQHLERGDHMRAAGELDWKLRQATGVAKAPHVADFVRLLVENGEKVVVYGWHKTFYEILRERLSEYHPVMFTGDESQAQKLEAKRLFMEGDAKVLLISLRAGAGLDGFQNVCRTVVFGELDWSPGVMEQCVGRVVRDGQKDPTTVYILVSEEGSDPVVSEKLGLKKVQIEGLKNPKTELVEEMQASVDKARSLAEHFLRKIGKWKDEYDQAEPPAAKPAEAPPAPAPLADRRAANP